MSLDSIIIEGNLKRCKKYRLIQTRWVEHYFVLYCKDSTKNCYVLNEYKSSRRKEVKKSFNLSNVYKIEANLSLTDPPVSCSSSSDNLNCIFSIGFNIGGVQKELHLVATNEEDMNIWVQKLCMACKLHRQQKDPYRQFVENPDPATFHDSTSVTGFSVSSESLETPFADHNYQNSKKIGTRNVRIKSYMPGNTARKTSEDANYKNVIQEQRDVILESCSDTSSLYSSRKNMTEEDSGSFVSVPPVPPPRSRHAKNNGIEKQHFIKNKIRSNLNAVAASTSMQKTANDDDSSGETLKIENPGPSYTESVTSSEGLGPHSERILKKIIRRPGPPPIDRTNKPKNLRLEEEPLHYRNLSRNNSLENGRSHHYTTYQTRTLTKETKPRKNIDYFEPSFIETNIQTVTTSTRSPTPSDIEYITVDVDRTLAFKEMRRAKASMD